MLERVGRVITVCKRGSQVELPAREILEQVRAAQSKSKKTSATAEASNSAIGTTEAEGVAGCNESPGNGIANIEFIHLAMVDLQAGISGGTEA